MTETSCPDQESNTMKYTTPLLIQYFLTFFVLPAVIISHTYPYILRAIPSFQPWVYAVFILIDCLFLAYIIRKIYRMDMRNPVRPWLRFYS